MLSILPTRGNIYQYNEYLGIFYEGHFSKFGEMKIMEIYYFMEVIST